MKNRDVPAMPVRQSVDRQMDGLTKREWFAGLALQGILASDINFNMDKHDVADQARQHADALLAKLEDTQ